MPITWIEIGDHDFKAEPEPGVMLRVEQMDEYLWWWAIYFKDLHYDCWSDGESGHSEKDAKSKCEELYKKLKDAKNNA